MKKGLILLFLLLSVSGFSQSIVLRNIGTYAGLSGTVPVSALPAATSTTFGATKLPVLQFLSASSGSPTSSTVNLGTGPQIIMVNNTGAGTHTVYLDQTTLTENQVYTITRYGDTDNGPVIVTLLNTTGNKIQNLDKSLTTSVTLGTATGQRQFRLWVNLPHLYNMGY